MTSPVRVGVAGVGHWAHAAHLPPIVRHPDATLAAIADPYLPNLERARSRFEPAAVFDDALKMIAQADLDAVVVATPHRDHYLVAAAAIAAGRHVLVEKPFVLEPAHGRELIDAAEQARVEIIVGYPWHYNSQSLAARASIGAGELGQIRYVDSFFGSNPLNLYRARPEASTVDYGQGADFFGPRPSTYSDRALAGGGQGQTQVTHSLACLLFLTGLRPVRVAAFMRGLDTEVDVIDAFTIRFEGGAIGTLGSFGATSPPTHTELLRYQVHGDAGHLEFDVMAGRLSRWNDTGSREFPSIPLTERYPLEQPATNLIEVALGRATSGSPADLAQRVVETLHAAYLSADRDGMPVDIPMVRFTQPEAA